MNPSIIVGNRDPLWISFPRWLEVSGLPETMSREFGAEAWLLFRKLVELDCDANLSPQWFDFRISDLSRWTGIPIPQVENLLDQLTHQLWIERSNTECEIQSCRISTPLRIPLAEAEIRKNLTGKEAQGGRFILRYFHSLEQLETVEKVIYLYQMLFGARFSPRIVEDLEEIANTYPMAVIYDIFQAAFNQKVKSLAWIKSHLHPVEE